MFCNGLTLSITSFVITFVRATQGHNNFYEDFLKAFAIENSLFLSTDGFENSPSDITVNNVTAFIQYTTNKEEREVANHIKKLHFWGKIAAVLFLDNGHGKLLKILMSELKLFNKGLTGLIPESDVFPELSWELRFDTFLFVYSTSVSTIHLKEIYGVNGKTIVTQIGTHKEGSGLSISATNMWDRRTDMEGMEIRVATLSYPFLHELYYDKLNTSVIGGGGLFIEPLNILAQKLNFSMKFMSSIDGQWGAMNQNGTWTGLIGMLIRGQADIAAAGLSLTFERTEVTTFGIGFELEEFTLMSPQTTEREVHLDVYLHIFPGPVWCLIGAMVISFGTCFATINYFGINYMHDTNDSEEFTLINGIGLSLTFFRQIYYNVKIESISSRTLFIISTMSTYLLYVHYSAYMTATTTTGIKESPVKSFKDVLSGGYQVFVAKNTADHGILKSAKPGTPMHDVYYKTMDDNPDAFLNSYKEVSRIVHTEKALSFGSAYYMAVLHDLTVLDIQEKIRTPFCWAFQKDSELVQIFNYHLQKMGETGTLSRLREEIKRNFHRKKDAGIVQDANVVGFENVAFPFLALLTGISLAFVQLGLEFVMFFKKNCACNPNPEDANMTEDDESRQIIKKVSELLQKNSSKPKDMKLLSQIRAIAMSGINKTPKL